MVKLYRPVWWRHVIRNETILVASRQPHQLAPPFCPRQQSSSVLSHGVCFVEEGSAARLRREAASFVEPLEAVLRRGAAEVRRSLGERGLREVRARRVGVPMEAHGLSLLRWWSPGVDRLWRRAHPLLDWYLFISKICSFLFPSGTESGNFDKKTHSWFFTRD